MSRSKQGTPVSENHPANKLTFIDEEIKSQLQKTPFQLLIEGDNYHQQLFDLRNDWKYAFVVQWLYLFRGAIRLSGEPFSIDLLEEELVGLSEPNLMNKIAINLVSITLSVKATVDDFSYKAMYLLGDTTTILGTEDQPINFNSLSLVDKFEVFYQLIFRLQYTDNFRKQVEKYEKENELRIEPIFELDEMSYFLLSDNRIYSRTISEYPKIEIPRKYKYAKNIDPETKFPEIDPKFEWKLVANGIYEIHDFLVSIQKDKKLKPLFLNIKEYINNIAEDDLNRRKKILKRKREQQLNELVSNRKRSSRIQEKEEQLKIEKEEREAEEARQREEQARIKAARKLKAKENAIKREFEERLRNSSVSRRTTVFDSGYEPGQPPKDLELKEGEWLFECYCGVREQNYDDGGKLISCERCLRWQHLKCQDRAVQQELIKNHNEVFVCNWCKQELEKEIELKIEEERIQLKKEMEEKQKQREIQREIQRQKEEEEKRRLEEEERLRKEELEKERERRTLEREKLREQGIYSQSPAPVDHQQQQAAPQGTPVHTNNNSNNNNHQQLPAMGSFQNSPQQSSPTSFGAPPQQQLQPQFQPQYQPQFQQQSQPQYSNEVSHPNHAQFPPSPSQKARPSVPIPQLTAQEQSFVNGTPQVQVPSSVPAPTPALPTLQTTPIPSTQPLSPSKSQDSQKTTSPEKLNESPSRSFSIQNILE